MSVVQGEVKYAEHVGEGKWVVEQGEKEGENLPGEYKYYTIPLYDYRPSSAGLSLHKEGFLLQPHLTKVHNFYNDEEVKKVYYPEVVDLLQNHIEGAQEIHIFDHTRRISTVHLREEKQTRPSAANVHGDYTLRSGFERVRVLFPGDAEERLKRRFMIINVWRSTTTRIENHPLGFIEATTSPLEDFLNLQRIESNRVGEITMLRHNPEHKWCYFAGMDRNEVAIFKTFDSLSSPEVSRWVGHSSVKIVDGPEYDRESIEIRAVVWLE
eukprot:TRINITY_DN796_c0_g1_i1.p1 TRINITY_DN796_c0_g1~~TRINITY_DN796_c0_g1_i1.p1  ORF type:complete len:280 (-),score=76.82 TRINITY_DN796_c0_g1_i1:64-867(-)